MLMDEVAQKGKLSLYLLTPMPIGSQVEVCSPQNISGASQQTSVAP